MQFAIDVRVAHQLQNVALQLPGAARIEQLRFVILVGQQLKIAQRAVGFGAGQRRHQVIDDHCLGAALGLGALARIVDDEWIDVRQRPEQRVRPAILRQPNTFARQPFKVAVLANMDHALGAVGVAQPEIKRQIAVGRHQVRVVIHRARVHLITARRLNADEGQAKPQAGDHHPPAAAHRVAFRRAPTLQHRGAIGFGQGIEHRQVFIHCQTLLARTLVESIQIVADTAEQLLDQRGAAVRQVRR
ncbi:hypothetical protein D3C73_607340 [compost metagenome]